MGIICKSVSSIFVILDIGQFRALVPVGCTKWTHTNPGFCRSPDVALGGEAALYLPDHAALESCHRTLRSHVMSRAGVQRGADRVLCLWPCALQLCLSLVPVDDGRKPKKRSHCWMLQAASYERYVVSLLGGINISHACSCSWDQFGKSHLC